VITEPSD